MVTLATAEKVLRDIARRNGESIKKRRSKILKEHFGIGYGVIDPNRNVLLSGGQTSDGCDFALSDLAKWYESDENNTTWQRTVINAALNESIAE